MLTEGVEQNILSIYNHYENLVLVVVHVKYYCLGLSMPGTWYIKELSNSLIQSIIFIRYLFVQ